MIASPSQLTPRMSMRGACPCIGVAGLVNLSFARSFHRFERSGCGLASQVFGHFPAIMHPEPIGGIASHRFFKGAVDVSHDGLRRARAAVLVSRNFITDLNAPFSEADAETKTCIESGVVAKYKNGRGGGGGTVVSEKRQSEATIAGTLIGQQPERNTASVHRGFQGTRIEATLKEKAAETFAQGLKKAIDGFRA